MIYPGKIRSLLFPSRSIRVAGGRKESDFFKKRLVSRRKHGGPSASEPRSGFHFLRGCGDVCLHGELTSFLSSGIVKLKINN